MITRRLLFLGLGLSALPGLIQAGVPGGEEKPYRQYPELPDVLYYEGFETAAVTWKGGTVDSTIVQAPGNHSYKLDKVKKDKDEVCTASGGVPVKFPAGMEPNEIHIQFTLWTDEPGELSVKLKEGDFEAKPHSFKTRFWCPVAMRVSDFIKDKKRPPKDASFTGVELTYKPRVNDKTASVFIDDFIITYRTPPANLLPAMAALEAKRAALIRSIARDGFTFSPEIKEAMQIVFKRLPAARRVKTVLIAGSTPADTEELAKSVKASAAKLKVYGLNFVAAAAPDGSPLGGLDDMRTLLSYSVRKSEAEMALLMLSNADSQKPGRPSEGVKAVLERTLEANCVPVLCLPPSEEGNEKGKLNSFINSLNNTCIELRVPCMDEGFGLKDAKDALKGKDLAGPGLEKFAEVAAQAIKYMEATASGRKP